MLLKPSPLKLSIAVKSAAALWRVIPGLLVGAALGIAFLIAALLLSRPFGFHPLVVVSGSMAPALSVGDIAVTRSVDPGDLQVGDLVTYHPGSSFVTHRVVRIEETPQGRLFELKGDANATSDSQLVSAKQVTAKVVYSIPKMGFVVAFANSQAGLGLLIVAPAVVLALMWYRGRAVQKAGPRQQVAPAPSNTGKGTRLW